MGAGAGARLALEALVLGPPPGSGVDEFAEAEHAIVEPSPLKRAGQDGPDLGGCTQNIWCDRPPQGLQLADELVGEGVADREYAREVEHDIGCGASEFGDALRQLGPPRASRERTAELFQPDLHYGLTSSRNRLLVQVNRVLGRQTDTSSYEIHVPFLYAGVAKGVIFFVPGTISVMRNPRAE